MLFDMAQVFVTGGDDDASGTSALLSLAQLFKAYGIRFKRTVQLVFFSGEEQGLWGSRAYAKMLRDNDTNVRFMLQADMLGYHLPGEPMQIAFPDRYDTIEAVRFRPAEYTWVSADKKMRCRDGWSVTCLTSTSPTFRLALLPHAAQTTKVSISKVSYLRGCLSGTVQCKNTSLIQLVATMLIFLVTQCGPEVSQLARPVRS